jgi:hypothetical protein
MSKNSGTRRIRVYGFGGAARVYTAPHQKSATSEVCSATSTPQPWDQTQQGYILL